MSAFIDSEISKRSPSESVSGPVESVLKVLAANPFKVRSGLRSSADPSGPKRVRSGSEADQRPAIE